MINTNSRVRILLFVLFTASGFTGLIYESIWTHYLKLFLGHAAYAQTLVLAIFMGGLAIGSWIAARFTHRLSNHLLAYALIEAIVGLSALLFDRTYSTATGFVFASVIPSLDTAATIQIIKWSSASLLILPQAILLGMTFPLVSAGIIRRCPTRSGETIALLYFTNSIGAAIGVLVGGFVLIGHAGLPGTIAIAGLMNLTLALIVWLAVRKQSFERPAALPVNEPGERHAHVRWMLIAAAATGAASFFYEIAWIRMLSLVLGSATHSFELMLSAFILGLGLGGFWVRSRIDRTSNHLRMLAFAVTATALAALATIPLYGSTFDVMAMAMALFTKTELGFAGFNAVSHAIAIAIMVPATFFAGMTLPVMTHALLVAQRGEQSIGQIYAANTLGSIVGVVIAVHVVIPVIGVKGLIALGALLHLTLGVAAWSKSSGSAAPRWHRPALLGACGALVLAVYVGVQFDPLKMTSAVYRTGKAMQGDFATVRYLRDGKTATISLTEANGDVAIATNGKPDALIRMGEGRASLDEVTMTLAAALPLMLHPDPKLIANIGIGSGLTSHVLLTSSQVEQLDSVEIEPLMVEAAHLGFMPRNRRLFEDKRSRIVFEDAKTFFASNRTSYDVIVSEPSNPWVSGVATLFSEEFYRYASGYLKDGGLLVQWVQVYETDIAIVASIAQALGKHFEAYLAFNTDDANILLIAKKRGSFPALDSKVFEIPELKAELARIGIHNTWDVEKRRIGDHRALRPLFLSFGIPVNSDFYPFVDLNAPRMRFMKRNALELTKLGELPAAAMQIIGVGPDITAHWRPAPAASFISFDARARVAESLRESIIRRDAALESLPIASQILSLELTAAQCAVRSGRSVWSASVVNLSKLLIPYLPGKELEPVWEHIRSQPCYAQQSGEDKVFIDLLAAVAMRRNAEILKLGSELYNPSSKWQPSSVEDAALALTAMSAGLIAQGRVEEAGQLLREVMPQVHAADDYALQLRTLLAMTLNTTKTSNGLSDGSRK